MKLKNSFDFANIIKHTFLYGSNTKSAFRKRSTSDVSTININRLKLESYRYLENNYDLKGSDAPKGYLIDGVLEILPRFKIQPKISIINGAIELAWFIEKMQIKFAIIDENHFISRSGTLITKLNEENIEIDLYIRDSEEVIVFVNFLHYISQF